MMSGKPVILVIGGGWHTPLSYARLTNAFKDAEYEVHCPQHPSVSPNRPPKAGLKEDTANMRSYVEDMLRSGKKVVAIAHSYGGQVASNSLHGLGVGARATSGLSGGVSMLIYMCAFAQEEGRSMIDQVTDAGHADLIPIAFKFAEDMTVQCADPRAQLIGEPLSDDEVNDYLSTLEVWNGQCMYDGIEHSAWRELPVSYISTHLDACVPLDYQKTMIDKLRNAGKKVEVLDLPNSGHCPNLTAAMEIRGVRWKGVCMRLEPALITCERSDQRSSLLSLTSCISQ